MSNPIPLFIVLGTVALLMLIQHLLIRDRVSKSPSENQDGKPGEQISHSILFPGLSVIGLDNRSMQRFRQLILTGNPDETTLFMAFNHCSVPELNTFLADIKAKLMAKRPKGSGKISLITLKTIFDSSMLPKPPEGIRFDALSDNERLDILNFDPNSAHSITRDFMARFGGHSFHKNFTEYCHHKKSAILCIPDDDHRRPIFEKLAESGIAEKGREIDLASRLALLSLKQLRQMAKDLNLKQEFKDKATAIMALADIPGSRVLFSMQFVVDDLFHLKPVSENDEKIRQEWGYLNAYAKLLLSTLDKSIPPTTTKTAS